MDTPRQSSLTGAPAAPVEPLHDAAASGRARRAAWGGALVATLFILSVLLSVNFTVAWALSGVLHIGKLASWIAAGAGAGMCLWVAVRFFCVALRNELALSEHRPEAG